MIEIERVVVNALENNEELVTKYHDTEDAEEKQEVVNKLTNQITNDHNDLLYPEVETYVEKKLKNARTEIPYPIIVGTEVEVKENEIYESLKDAADEQLDTKLDTEQLPDELEDVQATLEFYVHEDGTVEVGLAY